MMKISQKAIDLILAFEVGSQANYEARLQFPIWPGGSSGVTIGIGYDLGYVTSARFLSEWRDSLPQEALGALLPVIGLKGDLARKARAIVKWVRVPWKAAISVFERRTFPGYSAATAKAFPGCERLSEDCRGALVSLVYNRGASMDGERRLEMRQIRQAILDGKSLLVPGLIRAMKRIWVGTDIEKGMRRRREAEAKLFEEGFSKS